MGVCRCVGVCVMVFIEWNAAGRRLLRSCLCLYFVSFKSLVRGLFQLVPFLIEVLYLVVPSSSWSGDALWHGLV